jgi:hypothetical protein
MKLLPVGIHASTSSRCETSFDFRLPAFHPSDLLRSSKMFHTFLWSLVTPRRPSITLNLQIMQLMKVQNIRCEARLLLRKVKGVILTIAEPFSFPSLAKSWLGSHCLKGFRYLGFVGNINPAMRAHYSSITYFQA